MYVVVRGFSQNARGSSAALVGRAMAVNDDGDRASSGAAQPFELLHELSMIVTTAVQPNQSIWRT